MFTIASVTPLLTSSYADAGSIIFYAVGVVLAALVGLLGLGFGIRHLGKYITGRKF